MKASDVRTKMKTQTAKPGNSLKDKFRNQKQDLLKRHQEQVDNKDQGNDFPTIFDKSKIPEGIGFWKCGKGDHLLDCVPFFAGCQHPRVIEGELAYVVDLWVHMNVGPLRTPYPCTAKNFKETDPICEYISKNRLSKEEWKRVSSKRRTIYLVWVHDTPEEEKKGLQIWDVAHFYFEQHIDEIAKSPRGGGATAFSDIESGKSIAFSVKVTGTYEDANGKDQDSIGFIGHKFVDRDIDVIPNRILEQSFALDECINMHPDYEEMDEAFNGSPSEPGKQGRKKEEKEVTDDQDLSRETHEYEEDDIPSEGKKVAKGAGKKQRPKPEPEPLDEPTEEEITEDEGGEEETGEEEVLQEFETGGEENEEEQTECPHDVESFGEVDDHPECEADGGCPLWDLCSDESNRRKKEAEIQKPVAGKKPMASSAGKPKRKLGK